MDIRCPRCEPLDDGFFELLDELDEDGAEDVGDCPVVEGAAGVAALLLDGAELDDDWPPPEEALEPPPPPAPPPPA